MNQLILAAGLVAVACIIIGLHLSDMKPPQHAPLERRPALPPDDWELAALHLIDTINEEWKERQR